MIFGTKVVRDLIVEYKPPPHTKPLKAAQYTYSLNSGTFQRYKPLGWFGSAKKLGDDDHVHIAKNRIQHTRQKQLITKVVHLSKRDKAKAQIWPPNTLRP